LCVGATHAFGGLGPTLDAVQTHLRPGGRVLLGEGYWEGTPTETALEALGAEPGELPDVAGLVAEAQRSGFEPGCGHLSTAAEWDHYEWSSTGDSWASRPSCCTTPETADGGTPQGGVPPSVRSRRPGRAGGTAGQW
jgi:hypothetical protein